MRRRTVVVGLPILTASPRFSFAQVSDAEARKIIDDALASSEALLEEFLQRAASIPLTENFRPFEIMPILPARRDRILDSLQSTLGPLPQSRLRPLTRPEYAAYVSLTPDYGGLTPTRDETRIESRPNPRSQRKRAERILEEIFRFIGLDDESVIANLIEFSRNSPITGPYVREIENSIGSDNFRRVAEAIFRYLRVIATEAFLELWQRVATIGARSLGVIVIRRFAARFVPFLGVGLLLVDILDLVRSIYREVQGT
jgi:hypothetical protein